LTAIDPDAGRREQALAQDALADHPGRAEDDDVHF
jgi:hypothetical protein